MNKTLMILFSLILLGCTPAYSNEADEKEKYCESVDWKYDNICTNEVYCEPVYWEDEDNCTYVEADHLVDAEFCNSIPFESTRESCLQTVKDLETGK